MQICAKVGGEPWAVDNLPFTNNPTMVVGLDSYNKGEHTILGCCSTLNRSFTRYASIVKSVRQGADLSDDIADAIRDSIQEVY